MNKCVEGCPVCTYCYDPVLVESVLEAALDLAEVVDVTKSGSVIIKGGEKNLHEFWERVGALVQLFGEEEE